MITATRKLKPMRSVLALQFTKSAIPRNASRLGGRRAVPLSAQNALTNAITAACGSKTRG